MSPDGSFLAVGDEGFDNVRLIHIGTGVVTTLAGPKVNTFSTGLRDGAGTHAIFDGPKGVAWSPDGAQLYVADQDNNKIRKISLSPHTNLHATVTTFAGLDRRLECTEIARRPANESMPWASYSIPGYDDLLYWNSVTHEQTWTRPEGAVRPPLTLPRNGSSLLGADPASDSVRTCAYFFRPQSIRMSADGSHLIVADSANAVLKRVGVDVEGMDTFAGSSAHHSTTLANGVSDGVGSACPDSCERPPPDPRLLVRLLASSCRARRGAFISLARGIRLAGAALASFWEPRGLALSPVDKNRLFVADGYPGKIRKVSHWPHLWLCRVSPHRVCLKIIACDLPSDWPLTILRLPLTLRVLWSSG